MSPVKMFPIKLFRGFSLIELMISSVLSLLLLAVAIKLYQNHQATYRYQEGLARMQENARMAMHMLYTGIQAAGYVGCGRIDNIQTNLASKKLIAPDKIIGSYKSNEILPDSDAIFIRHMNTQAIQITAKLNRNDTILFIKPDKGLKQDDNIIIADCTQMQTTKIIEQTSKQVRITPELQYSFSSQAQIGRLTESRFYLADTERINSMGQPIFSLYWMDVSRHKLASEVIEGVEKMKIRYGVLLPSGLLYQSADQIKDWSKVRTVQIALLLNSIEPVLQKSESYLFQGNTHQSTDRILRREWTTQITLRALL